MKLKTILTGLALTLICAIGFGQTAKKPIQKKQAVQQKRISQGVKSGELTKKEAVKLRAQQKEIARAKHAAKADGIVTKKERAVIHQKQNAANRNIVRKKNNEMKRKK